MKKKGISLIVLVITIVVIIILAAAVILSLGKNNPINSAKEAKVKTTIDNFKSDLLMSISKIAYWVLLENLLFVWEQTHLSTAA